MYAWSLIGARQGVTGLLFGLAICFAGICNAQDQTLTFAERLSGPLQLDFYAAENVQQAQPLVVWVHGGAWRRGSRQSVPVKALTQHGFSLASVDYRLTPVAQFPAQVEDIRAAIDYLLANASELHIDTKRIAIAGASAGGHLAALVGVSYDFDFDRGRKSIQQTTQGPSHPVANPITRIVSFYGASNLETILAQSTPHGLSVRVPALELLLGGSPDSKRQLASWASPVFHVDKRDPPLLLIHGDQDPQMPINQAHELQGKYEAVEGRIEFDVVHGAAHGGEAFYTDAMLQRVAAFLREE